MLRNFLIFGVFLLSLHAPISFATPTLDESSFKVVLQRGNYSKVTVSFTIKNFVMPADFTTYSMQDTSESAALMLTRYMDVCIFTAAEKGTKCVDGTTPKKVQYLSNTTADTTPELNRRNDYGISFPSGSPAFIQETEDTTGATRRLEVTFDIISAGSATFSPTDTDIAIRLPLGSVTSPSQFIDKDAVAKLAVAATGVLTSVSITPSIGTLTAIWDKSETLERDGDTASVANGATAFVVPEDQWETVQIPVHTYSKADPESETIEGDKCHIVGGSGTSCDLECGGTFQDNDGAHYLKDEDLKAAGIPFVTSGNTGSLSINGLKAGTRYAFVYQNQPDGLQRSCFIASPSDAVTLTQLGGGPEPTARDPRCFIATAAYGSALDPHLDTLRWFRDHVLLVTKVGNTLVQTYYTYSPPLAEFIAEHPTLRAITRGLLWAPVMLIETWRERPSFLLTLSAMSGTFLLLFLRRRSLRASV